MSELLPLLRLSRASADIALGEMEDGAEPIEDAVVWQDYVRKILVQLEHIETHRRAARPLARVLLAQLMPYGDATIEDRASWIGVSAETYRKTQLRLLEIIQTLQRNGF